MAAGHLNPGYGDPVTRFHRAKSSLHAAALPGAQTLRDFQDISADRGTLEDIRKRAREVWLQKDKNETSYQDHYKDRLSSADGRTPARPTSASRRHNPHPPMVFLTTRLKYCPGYHDADASLGKEMYRTDASVPASAQERRAQARAKYTSAVDTAATNQYRTNLELECIEDPVERQTKEAFYKMAPPKEKEILLEQLQEQRETRSYRGAHEPSYRPRTVPSLHRYMREAGAAEYDKLTNLTNKYLYGQESPPVDVVTRRNNDIDNYRTLDKYTHRSKRGDFLLHPQWPPTMGHHRLNGLSSIDVPYFPGKR